MADKNNAQETMESLGALKYKELQALAKNRGIKANLSKAQLVQELLAASAQHQHQTDSTETPADIDMGGAGAGGADVGGDAGVGSNFVAVVGGGDGDGVGDDRPQDGALADDAGGEFDGGGGGDSSSDADDKPHDRSQDKSEGEDTQLPQDESQDKSQEEDAQHPQDDSSTPEDDCNELMGVCDEPEVESFRLEDAVGTDQNDDSTSPTGPIETEQQQQQQQQEEQQQQQQLEEEQQQVQVQQQPEEQQQQPEEQQEQKGQAGQEEEQQEQKGQEEEQQVEPQLSERRRSERLVVVKMQEKKSVTIAPRKIQSPKFVTKRAAACPSSRFDLAHQNMFASQPSIERYGKTPRKTPKKTPRKTPKKTDATKGKVPAVRQTLFKAKTPSSKANANTPAGTSARPIEAVIGSGLKSVKRGLTVASKPCTLVVQRSNKKPTQVKEFRLSSNPRMREGFTFKPYSGPIRPIMPALGALADKSSSFNVGPPGASAQASQKLSKKAVDTLEPVGIKAKLASGRAQAARRTAHLQSGKANRENKLAEGRAGRD